MYNTSFQVIDVISLKKKNTFYIKLKKINFIFS